MTGVPRHQDQPPPRTTAWDAMSYEQQIAQATDIDCPFCDHGTRGEKCMRADSSRRDHPHQARIDAARRLFNYRNDL